MRGQSLIGTIVGTVIFFLILSFAIRLLPYILLGLLVWYFVRAIMKPLTGQKETEDAWEKKENNYYSPKAESEDHVADSQVKSVYDDDFFKQDHDVVDVDYDEEEKK